MDPLEIEFERRLRESIRESIELGYHPTRIAEMIDAHHGKNTAKLLVKSGEIQAGILRIVAMGHPELSVESIMLETQFAPLFSQEEWAAAQWRLDRAKEGVHEDGE
jgi:hypothetical protein